MIDESNPVTLKENLGSRRIPTLRMANFPNADEIVHGKGCDACRGSGYVGRAGIFELLVIDDNDAVRTALDVLLTLEGARVECVATAREGLERVARGGIDLVIQDMNFQREATSGDEGIALFRALRAMQPDLPVVLLTAWTHLETAVELVKAGAADYLAKPWDNARLVTTVRNLLELRAALVGGGVHKGLPDRLRTVAPHPAEPVEGAPFRVGHLIAIRVSSKPKGK